MNDTHTVMQVVVSQAYKSLEHPVLRCRAFLLPSKLHRYNNSNPTTPLLLLLVPPNDYLCCALDKSNITSFIHLNINTIVTYCWLGLKFQMEGQKRAHRKAADSTFRPLKIPHGVAEADNASFFYVMHKQLNNSRVSFI